MPEFGIEGEIYVTISLFLEGISIDPNVTQTLSEFIQHFCIAGEAPIVHVLIRFGTSCF